MRCVSVAVAPRPRRPAPADSSTSRRRRRRSTECGSSPSAESDRTCGCGSARSRRSAPMNVSDVVATRSSSASCRVPPPDGPSRRKPVAIIASSVDPAQYSSPASCSWTNWSYGLSLLNDVDQVVAIAIHLRAIDVELEALRSPRSGRDPSSAAPSARRSAATRAPRRRPSTRRRATCPRRTRRPLPASAAARARRDRRGGSACGDRRAPTASGPSLPSRPRGTRRSGSRSSPASSAAGTGARAGALERPVLALRGLDRPLFGLAQLLGALRARPRPLTPSSDPPATIQSQQHLEVVVGELLVAAAAASSRRRSCVA